MIRLHRIVGIGAAVFALLLAITGMLLNHTGDLHLSERRLRVNWLLAIYGVKPPQPMAAFVLGSDWVSQWGSAGAEPTAVFLNGTRLTGAPTDSLIAAFAIASTAEVLALVTKRGVTLLNRAGEQIDELAAPGSAPVVAAERAGRILLKTADGRRWLIDDDLLGFEEQTLGEKRSVEPPAAARHLPAPLRSAIERHYRGDGVTLEQVVLDLHSGRLAGRLGPWLADAAALALILLALTGLWMVIGRSRRRRTARER